MTKFSAEMTKFSAKKKKQTRHPEGANQGANQTLPRDLNGAKFGAASRCE